jgi:uncharacterized membrane protein YhaH (DUF805 family)
MNCSNCNNPISSEDRFCKNCGYQLKPENAFVSERQSFPQEFYNLKIPNGFINRMLYWYKMVFMKYAVFKGRASRAEFWYALFFYFLIFLGLVLLGNFILVFIFNSEESKLLFVILPLVIWAFINLIPFIALTIRRLHDINLSGWWILLGFIPYIGKVVLLILLALDSYPYDNKYGPSPKKIYETEKKENYDDINQTENKFIYCTQCYHENNPINNFCTNCGAKLTKNELS